jgi:phage terminase small subunit
VTAGRKQRPTLLKLISGGGDHRRERLRDDKPKIDAPPCVPPTATLTEDEQQMWRWLLEHVYIPHVHGSAEALLFTKICKLWTRANLVEQKLQEFGCVMKWPRDGRPMVQPYYRIARDCWWELGSALTEIGATPSDRVHIAARREKSTRSHLG